jgi:3-hydroxybenzoate 6-monooxygenase
VAGSAGAAPIIIAGGGIGGLSAALALANRGIASMILERAAEIREIGAGIQLGPNAFRAFERLGITDAKEAIAFEPRAIRLMDSVPGEELSRQTLGEPFERRFGFPYRVAYRADVQRVLFDAVRQRSRLITVRLGQGVERVAPLEDHVRLTLDDGSSHIARAVIGADGIHSKVREAVFGAAEPRFSGHVAYRAILPCAEVPADSLTDDVQVWVGPGHHLVCYKLRRGEIFNIVAIFHSDRRFEGWDIAGDRNELLAGFAAAGPRVRRLLDIVHDGRMWVICDRDPQPGWSAGCVTLLGDAAHPMLPYLAQGACMAIEDSVRLAEEISVHPRDISAAFRAYEAARYARTADVQALARQTGESNHASGLARERRNAAFASRRPDDYEALAWLFDGDGPQRAGARAAGIGFFGASGLS